VAPLSVVSSYSNVRFYIKSHSCSHHLYMTKLTDTFNVDVSRIVNTFFIIWLIKLLQKKSQK